MTTRQSPRPASPRLAMLARPPFRHVQGRSAGAGGDRGSAIGTLRVILSFRVRAVPEAHRSRRSRFENPRAVRCQNPAGLRRKDGRSDGRLSDPRGLTDVDAVSMTGPVESVPGVPRRRRLAVVHRGDCLDWTGWRAGALKRDNTRRN